MKRIVLLTSPALIAVALGANAGTLNNGSWSPGGCGTLSEAPAVDSSSVDTINRSIAAVNEWQKQVQSYDECMIKEANADTSTIANSANAQQARYREASQKINAEAAAGREKFSSQSSSPGISNPGMGNPGMNNPGSGVSGQGY
ncbi:hypothetical protein EBAPG3_011680 [Nitrosospira lacus]|uniref:Uncharacterized protein n=1 Tax=Nitrosospira lacus TaxID=1288494 RepID=A0A1W6SRG5_9PROT|nr:hypothetical protein [Nitrosospira lacus]ARO88379.1 hypothetical protein EBAPG3_011680 [Nitrosospira lacus]